ncbi:NUDIX hydrolase [Streptacidiphilus sp. N1-12]|uniref:NUDIX hydrolase n=2 Tax=Streptacidiphilus alkalitolerans TaxID=3342712 RepID=A0ABV6VAQ5_9ACTN
MTLPPSWAERIAALGRGELTPPPPRLAATVVLLREAPPSEVPVAPTEAYLLRRRASMAFAGGMYAFPGGGVDPRDGTAAIGWAGPSAEEWAERLGCPPETARAVVCAAVRETFEESGVLLAGADADSVVADVSGEQWRADRAALEAHELSFAEFLTRRGLLLRSDLLGGWARWITPEFEDRRYDTWFFVAAVPQGQRTAEVPGEADRVEWLAPAEAVARAEAGEYLMLPPTVTTLRELARCIGADGADEAVSADDGRGDSKGDGAGPARVLAAAGGRSLGPIMARAETRADGRVSVSWDGYPELTMGSTER